MTIENVRVPPDSTGKRINVRHSMELNYTTGSRIFVIGEEVIGGTTGAKGTISAVEGTASSGYILLDHDKTTAEAFSAGEALQVEASTVALAATQTDYFTQKVIIVGGANSENAQAIDSEGQAAVRFAEGAQQFNPFGVSKVVQSTILAEYMHDKGANAGDYSEVTATGATVAHNSTESALILSTTGSTGSHAQLTTNRYHKYYPGAGTLTVMSVSCGDTGKANNERAWGLFDDDNGVFFKLNGSGGLSVVQRSAATGSIVDTAIFQADWNGDTLDGNGLSQMNIDVTKLNIFWIDFQWLGAGQVRFGVFRPDGGRVICHAIRNANSLPIAYMQTGSLPVRVENEDIGVAGSPSTLRYQCCAVKSEGPVFPYIHDANQSGAVKELQAVTSTLAPVCSLRAAASVEGIVNRNLIQVLGFSISVQGTGNVLAQVLEDTSLTGATWAAGQVGAADTDIAASAVTDGKAVWSKVLSAGDHEIDLRSVYDYTSNTLRLNADGTQDQNVVLAVKGIGASATVTAAANWQELG